MLAAESPGVVHHETVSEWFQKHLPTSPSERRGEVWGFCRIPGCVASGPSAPASLLPLVGKEKHHRFSAICLTAGTPLLNRASRVFTSFAAFSM